jgi:hypothetical protein
VACYGCALPDPLLTILPAVMIPAILHGSSAGGMLAWILLFQLVILIKLVLRLSAFADVWDGRENEMTLLQTN